MDRRLVCVVGALVIAGCAGSGGTIAEPNTPVPTTAAAPADGDPDFVRTESGEADGAAPETTEFDLAAQPSTPAIPEVPETGVPGIDSADAFCRAWSEFAGSFQAIGLVSAVGDADNARRVEVFAAPAVRNAILALEANLPAELEPERIALVVDFAGPFATRALIANALLVDGMGEALAPAWIEQLTVAGVDDPFLTVELPSAVDASVFEAAVTSFTESIPAVVDDESLITDVQIPLTEAYLAGNCPDGGILSGNDVITE